MGSNAQITSDHLTNVTFSKYWRKTIFTKAEFLTASCVKPIKMFNLFRKPQFANAFTNGLRIARNPLAAGFCTEEPPRRIEKSNICVTIGFEVRFVFTNAFVFAD